MGTVGRRRSRWLLVAVFAMFAAPILVAWLMFFVFEDWRPAGTTNHGVLVQPPRALQLTGLRAGDGSAIAPDWLEGKWTYVYLADAQCDGLCRDQLYRMRQVRLAQGKNIDRVQRLAVVMNAAGFADAAAHYPGLVLLSGQPEAVAAWMAEFELEAGERPALKGRIYLVDPMGNLMMFYEPDADAKGMVKDLERLLKISYVG